MIPGAAGAGLFWTSAMKLLEFLGSKRSRGITEFGLEFWLGLFFFRLIGRCQNVFFHFCSKKLLSSSCLSGFGLQILKNIVLDVKYLMMHMI